jgi:death on curing protein
MMKDILFLTLAEVVDIHGNQIELYGGLPGIRDINLLSSAIAMPHASFHGEYLHNDIFEMAAAYAFHISRNHPFVDGNKRTALVSAMVFLELNGSSISDPHGELYDAMLNLSTGKLNKSEFASILRKLKD